MANLILPRKRVVQPQVAARLKPEYKKPCIFSLPLSATFVENINRYSPTISGNPYLKAAPFGIGVRTSQGNILTYPDIAWSKFTLMATITPEQLNNSAGIFVKRNPNYYTLNGGIGGMWLRLNGSTGIACAVWNTSGSVFDAAYTGTIVAGDTYHIVATCAGTGYPVRIFVNDVEGTPSANTSGTLGVSGSVTQLGATASTNDRWFTGTIGNVHFFNDVLNNPKVLSANPWQIFEPQKSVVYFDVGAGGGITGTLSSTQDNNSISSQALISTLATTVYTQDSNILSSNVANNIISIFDNNQDANTLNSNTTNNIATTSANTQHDNAISSQANIANNATLTVSQDNNTLLSDGIEQITSQLTVTQDSNTISSNVLLNIVSNFFNAQSSNVLDSTATLDNTITGILSINQDSNTLSSNGVLNSVSNFDNTQFENTVSSTTTVEIKSDTTISQDSNTLYSESLIGQVIVAILVAIQDSNNIVSDGSITVTGIGSNVQQNNDIQSVTNIFSVANFSNAQSSNVLDSIVTLDNAITGTLNVSQDSNTISSNGILSIIGSSIVSQENNTLSSTGILEPLSGGIVGTLNVVQQSQNIGSDSVLIVGSSLNIGQESNTISSNGLLPIVSNLNVIQDSNTTVSGILAQFGAIQDSNILHSYVKIHQYENLFPNLEQVQLNYLSPTGFKLEIDRIPNVTFFMQECELPSLDMYTVDINTPMLDYPLPGNKLRYNPFTISFIVDERMKNYQELVTWMEGINSPESLDNNREYSFMEQYRLMRTGKDLFSVLFSDAWLHVLNNDNNENLVYKFNDMFPVSLGNIRFSTTVDDIKYLSCTATFRYSYFSKI